MIKVKENVYRKHFAWFALFFMLAAAFIANTPFAFANSNVEVIVEDRASALTSEEESFLVDNTKKAELPGVVKEVMYVTFASNTVNLNDDMERFLRVNYPSLIGEDKYKNGTLFVAVGFSPRQVGVYCGDDVCEVTDLDKKRQLDSVLDTMVSPLRDGDTAQAMLTGVTYAGAGKAPQTFASLVYSLAMFAFFITPFLLIPGILFLALFYGIKKQSKEKSADLQEKLEFVKNNYGDVAQRLSQIDIRANSLQSDLADADLKKQWNDIRQEFLSLNDTMYEISHIKHDAKDRVFLKHHKRIEKAHESVSRILAAEKNIDKLFNVEKGSKKYREIAMRELISDMKDLKLSLHYISSDKRDFFQEHIDEYITQAESIDVASSYFVDEYADLIKDYARVSNAYEEALIDNAEKEKMRYMDKEAMYNSPSVYDNNWRVGTGYGGYRSHRTIINDYRRSEERYQRNQMRKSRSSSSNRSYRSGFSGGGGSRRW